MSLPQLQLTEPLVDAMITLLSGQLPGVIEQMNATITDGILIDEPVQYLPFMPVPSVLQGGMPAVGIQRLPSRFVDDLQFTVDAVHEYAVCVIVQNADHLSLTRQLDRTLQCIAYTIQQDRIAGIAAGSGGVMRDQGGAWSVNLTGTEPGPLLGDIDPTHPDSPPRSYVSWTALVMNSTRREVG